MNNCQCCKHLDQLEGTCLRLCDPKTGAMGRVLTAPEYSEAPPCKGTAFEPIERPEPIGPATVPLRDPDSLSELEELRLSITFLTRGLGFGLAALTRAINTLASPPPVETALDAVSVGLSEAEIRALLWAREHLSNLIEQSEAEYLRSATEALRGP